MKVQILAFRADALDPATMQRRTNLLELAVSEFPGLVTGAYVTYPADHVFGGITVWEDGEALARFRHSELYAKLVLSPDVDETADQEVPFEDALAEQLAAAA